MPESPVITFRALPDFIDALKARGREGEPLGGIARNQIERYFYALQKSLEEVSFTEAEAMLVVDACNGTWWDPRTIDVLWAGVADACEIDHLDEKWHVDGPALVERLRRLTYAQCLAVVDAIERFWRDPNAEGQLKQVGLTE